MKKERKRKCKSILKLFVIGFVIITIVLLSFSLISAAPIVKIKTTCLWYEKFIGSCIENKTIEKLVQNNQSQGGILNSIANFFSFNWLFRVGEPIVQSGCTVDANRVNSCPEGFQCVMIRYYPDYLVNWYCAPITPPECSEDSDCASKGDCFKCKLDYDGKAKCLPEVGLSCTLTSCSTKITTCNPDLDNGVGCCDASGICGSCYSCGDWTQTS